jgi:hypothetical protein
VEIRDFQGKFRRARVSSRPLGNAHKAGSGRLGEDGRLEIVVRALNRALLVIARQRNPLAILTTEQREFN